jgi:hypothetical protein
MLDSQFEDFNLNTPYLNPRTGDVVPSYIPVTARAQVRTALDDLVGSVFTYPGRILGLPGKGELIRDLNDNIIDTDYNEFNTIKRTDLTPEQKDYQKTIREFRGESATYSGAYRGPTLPPGPVEDKFEL